MRIRTLDLLDSGVAYDQTKYAILGYHYLAGGSLYKKTLKVPKCEIFHLFDCNDFYGIKSL